MLIKPTTQTVKSVGTHTRQQRSMLLARRAHLTFTRLKRPTLEPMSAGDGIEALIVGSEHAAGERAMPFGGSAV